MILSPIDAAALPALLARFGASLDDASAAAAFWRIARIADRERAAGAQAEADHEAALRLAAEFGMGILPGNPRRDVSWDGFNLRAETEAYVLIHEVAHLQLASPARRRRIDFGLGAGPETGLRAAADRAQCLDGLPREREEARASLLGILWEAELGQPALASLLDQNWLEGAGRRGAAEHFCGTLAGLREEGFLDAEMRPTRRLRQRAD
jgi:hypothetical protein